MADLRTVKEILASLETGQTYIQNHLSNIDQHLNKLNDRTNKNERGISKIYGVGSGIVGLCALVALILKIVGVY